MANNSNTDIEPLLLDGESLSLEQVIAVARDFKKVELAPLARAKMARSRELVEKWVGEGRSIYGITSGFGSNQDKPISLEDVEQLQENIILSHSAGVGDPLPEEAVRALMLLRAGALARGFSGIRVETVERLLELLNRRVSPVIPTKGSVGSSGDLAPLAHMTLVMLGRGEAFYEGERLTGAVALGRAQIAPVVLKAKEGLALTNGTQFMTAIGALTLWDAERLLKVADLVGAMSLEAMQGKSAAFSEQVHQLRPFAGQIDSAGNVRRIIKGSELVDSPPAVDGQQIIKIQDFYSLRCLPQVHGASRQAVAFARCTLEVEINSVTDNPLILPDHEESISAGNFHGQPVALAMDFLSLALSEIGSISERRTAKLLEKRYNGGLPDYLVEQTGLNSGLMLAQYTAAALASENKVLIHPASGDSIPTSSGYEDHNSMGSIAARQAREVLGNVEQILAVELLCAAQALGIRAERGLRPGTGTAAAYDLVRRHIPQRASDRDGEIYLDIEKAVTLIRGGDLLQAVELAVGKLD
jgi:histidine ammonia-lyase